MSSKRSNLFLKECMADALLGLMQHKDYGKITINEIALAAGVNRSTWFRNFESKGDALSFRLEQLWLDWASQRGLDAARAYNQNTAAEFFLFVYAHRELLSLLLRSGLQGAVYEAFYAIMRPQFALDPQTCYESRFYSYGLFGLLGEWWNRDFRDTPEEMVAMYLRMRG